METMEVKPVGVEEMSVMGADPYKELEMYLDKVNVSTNNIIITGVYFCKSISKFIS